MFLKKSLFLFFLFIFFSFLFTACITVVTGSSGNTVNDAYRKTLSFNSQALDLNDLICNFGPKNFEAAGRTQVKTTVVGSGFKPEEIIISRSLGAQPKSGSLPSISSDAGWQARGNALNCSILGCPSGTYSVAVRYPQGSSCPKSVILELQVL